MKLLIVVPTLNSYLLLRNLINSLRVQTFKSWRVLFIEGNSNKKHRDWIENLCTQNSNYSIKYQTKENPGIFGAMNQGFGEAHKDEWILFWGSDDWVFDNESFDKLFLKIKTLSERNCNCDLAICRAVYYDIKLNKKGRVSSFLDNKESSVINGIKFRQHLISGCSPPHQGTVFGPKSIQKLNKYNHNLKLSADLDYFLKLSRDKLLKVAVIDIDLLYMGSDGVSSKNTIKRLKEVINAYFGEFKYLFWLPLFLRYIRKIRSLIKSKI